jgi:hypothetical protein
MQHAFGAVRGPSRQQDMAVSIQRTSSMCRHKASISHKILSGCFQPNSTAVARPRSGRSHQLFVRFLYL